MLKTISKVELEETFSIDKGHPKMKQNSPKQNKSENNFY